MFISRDMFLPSIGRHRPQLLIFDAASSHVSVPLVQLAIKEKISLIILPGKTTSFLQPVDQIFSHLISSFSEISYKLCFSKFDFLVRPNNFPPVLKQAIKAAWKKETIVNAFIRTGIKKFYEILTKNQHLLIVIIHGSEAPLN